MDDDPRRAEQIKDPKQYMGIILQSEIHHIYLKR